MTKSGKLLSGMGGRFHPELVAGLFRNAWQLWARICSIMNIINMLQYPSHTCNSNEDHQMSLNI
jgi:hypothetical protein